MRIIKYLLTLFFGTLILASCSNKIFYSSELNAQVAQKKLDVNKIQFYVSKKIVLKRVLPHNNAELASGEIHFEDGKLIDQIIIKKNTPGTCEFIDGGFMFMSFEEGNNKLLKFNQGGNGKYYELFINQNPDKFRRVTYDTAEYIIQRGADYARLWVRKDQDFILKITNRVAEGKKVKESN